MASENESGGPETGLVCAKRKGGRPTVEQARQRKVARALAKFHDVLPNLLIEVAELAGASSTSPAVKVQLLQNLDKLLALLPAESRREPRASTIDDVDWASAHRQALVVIEKDEAERNQLRARIAELEGKPAPQDRIGRPIVVDREKCGSALQLAHGQFGSFVGCHAFPKCDWHLSWKAFQTKAKAL